MKYEDVALTTSDGLRLSGWYIPSQNGAAVILLHGYGTNRIQMRPPSVSDAVARLSPRPVLLISTGQDFEQRTVARFYDFAREPKRLWNIPEAGHVGGLATRPKEYESQIISFFDSALLK